MEAKAYNARTLYAKIAEQIRSAIESGDLRPGDRLPPLAQLAERFGCSRATVREALGALRGQGLVELRHGKGAYVRTAALEMWMEPLEAAILLSRDETSHLLELLTAMLAGIATSAAEKVAQSTRATVSTGAGGAAAADGTAPVADGIAEDGTTAWETVDIGELAQALFAVECAQPSGEEVISAELSFYLTLAVASGNVLFENGLRVLQEALRSSLRLQNESLHHGKQVCRDVFDAVLAGNAVQARELLFSYGAALQAEIQKMHVGKGFARPS